MRTELALNHIANRVQELGWNNCEIYLRHVRANRLAKTTYDAGSDLWILIEEHEHRNTNGTYQFPGSAIRVESTNGVFDVVDEKVSEQEHEHTGNIELSNRLSRVLFVKFLQVTPKRKCHYGKENRTAK